MGAMELRQLAEERQMQDLRVSLNAVSANLASLRGDFDHLIEHHLAPTQSSIPQEIICSHDRQHLYAMLFSELFPNLGRVFATGRVNSPVSAGFTGGDERSSPSSSLPTLDSPSPCTDEEEYFPAPNTTEVSPVVQDSESADASSGDDESVGEGVWEILGGGGIREDSV
jgi:hypothetical protein